MLQTHSPWSVISAGSLIVQDTIVLQPTTELAIGSVLMVERSDERILVVKKAAREDYEFSGLWVMPGGLLRTNEPLPAIDAATLARLAASSLEGRARLESGWPGSVDDFEPVFSVQPRVTSYVSKGTRRYTLVLPFRAKRPFTFVPAASDLSVVDAAWMSRDDIVGQLAPANCLILAAMVWPRLTTEERVRWQPSVDSAHIACRQWATEAAWPDRPAPWTF